MNHGGDGDGNFFLQELSRGGEGVLKRIAVKSIGYRLNILILTTRCFFFLLFLFFVKGVFFLLLFFLVLFFVKFCLITGAGGGGVINGGPGKLGEIFGKFSKLSMGRE